MRTRTLPISFIDVSLTQFISYINFNKYILIINVRMKGFSLSLSHLVCVCDYPTVFFFNSGGPNKKKSVESTDLIKRE